MSNIRESVEGLQEPAKSIGKALIEFYDTMKALENDPHRGGKQATKIIMTINDIEKLLYHESVIFTIQEALWEFEHHLEVNDGLITEAISDVHAIYNLNERDVAMQLIRNTFVVINRLDLKEDN